MTVYNVKKVNLGGVKRYKCTKIDTITGKILFEYFGFSEIQAIKMCSIMY